MASNGESDPNLALYHAIELLDGDTKQRLSAIEIIQGHVDTHTLGRDELNALCDSIVSLLKDNNFKVCIGALRVVTVALEQAGDHCKALAAVLVPALIERLGDGKVAVRKAALEAIFVIIDGLHSPSVVHERFAGCWSHKNKHIREFILKIAIHCFEKYGTKFTANKREVLVKDIVHLLSDSSSSVRETAMSCIEAAYAVLGKSLRSTLKDYGLRSAHMKEINSRLDQIEAPSAGPAASSAPASRAAAEAPHHSAASGSGSPTGRPASGKRGGFGDGGGVTTDGTISNADPIHVKSSHDLHNLLDDIKEALSDTTENWQARMQYMVKLEGIILGNGKKYDLLPQQLNHMKTCFIEQTLDRRSAVSRQACHLLTVISEHMGSSADSIVEHLVPVLFKVVVISVQVQADAAHCAVKKMMQARHVGKLVTQISNNLQKSRNAKLRCACIDYFHVILESWLKPEYDHYISSFETGLKSALSDASKDVRARARETFVMYKSDWPENAAALFDTLSSSAQKAIAQAGAGKKKRATKSARQSIRSQMLKSDFAAKSDFVEGDGDQSGNVFIFAPKKEQCAHAESAGDDYLHPSDTDEPAAQPEARTATTTMAASRKKADRLDTATKAKSPRLSHDDSVAAAKKNAAAAGFSLKGYLKTMGARNLSWNVKVEKNTAFKEWIWRQDQAVVAEVSPEMERLVFVFMDHFNDPHHKVALSSLSLFEALVPLCLHMLEPFVQKFCPPLFLKMVDPKEQIRSTASEILMTMGERYSVETLIPALSRSLKTNKHPRSRIAVLEFSVKYFRKNTATSPHVLEGWLSLIGPFICEKVVEVRRAAAAALVRIYQSVDAEPVLAYILSLAPGDQSVVRKAVHSFVGSIDKELQAYAASQNIHNLCWLDKAGAEEKRSSREATPDRPNAEEQRNARDATPGAEPRVSRESQLEELRDSNSKPERGGSNNYQRFLQTSMQNEVDSNVDSTGYKAKGKGGRSTSFALREVNTAEVAESAIDVEMHDLQVILVNLGKCNLKQDYALKQFSTLARKYPSSVWEVFWEDTISKLLDYVQSGVPGVRACALLSIKEFAHHQAELLSGSLGEIVSLVVEALNEVHLEVNFASAECLMALAEAGGDYMVELLLEHLASCKQGALVSLLRALGALAKAGQLNARLGDLLPMVIKSFNSPDADIRKATVFFFVDLYSGMGNALMPHLSPLSTAQLKLLTIYIQRNKENSSPIV